MRSFAILTDVTRCIGCEQCVAACKQANHTGNDEPWPWQGDPSGLSATRWTSIVRGPKGRYVRIHCRHCLDPACASACPVGALHKSPEGPVVYDASICLGCRYCMVACPFRITRYEWSSPVPRVRKCFMCYERIEAGEIRQPACTAACPTQATIFGERGALLAEAKRRIAADPGRYLHHVWGEEEVGGTSVLYVSDVDLGDAGWPATLRDAPYPALTRPALHLVPGTFLGVGAAMFGLSWVIGRRQKLAREAESHDADPARRPNDPEEER
jgi:formate dehydrogenase iron-sulfur subunit